MMDNEHAGRQLMLRNQARAKRELKLLRENSSEVTRVSKVVHGLGEALENNTHVTFLMISPTRGQQLNEGNMEKIFRFVEESESLKVLQCRDLPYNFARDLLVALSRRKKGLDDLSLVIKPTDLDPFNSFLLNTPLVKRLRLSFNGDTTAIDPQIKAAIFASASISKAEHIRLNTAERPCDFLAAFKNNSNVKEVTIVLDGNFPDAESRRQLASLRACKNAHYSVLLSFEGIDWDRELWSTLVDELQSHELTCIKELYFTEIERFPDFCTEVFPRLFEGTRRKLEFGYNFFRIDEKLVDAIVASTFELNTGYLFQDSKSMQDFLTALAKPNAVVESLELPLGVENVDTFAKFAPSFRRLKSLSLEVDDFVEQDEEARLYIDKIKNALWKNRSLTGKIELTGENHNHLVNDTDRAFLERIVQRNRSLPQLLDPRHLISVPHALIPFLFQHASETDPNELYQAICSSVLLTFPRKKRHASK